MRSDAVYLIDGSFYRILYRDPGDLRPEDKGLWRALHVIWDGDHWGVHDDDDFLIDPEKRRIVAREVGWTLIKHTFHGASPSYGVECTNCHAESWQFYNTEADAVEAWNRAMGAQFVTDEVFDKVKAEVVEDVLKSLKIERTAKVIKHFVSFTTEPPFSETEYLCDACKKKVIDGDDYCSHCGCRLEWE